MSTADTRTTVAAAYEDETVVLGYLQHRKRFAWQRLLHNIQSARLKISSLRRSAGDKP